VFNDLIGLKRAWAAKPGDGSGTVDCCLLAAEVRRRLGYYDFSQDFAWVFEQYSDDTLPPLFMAKWLLQHGSRLKQPEPHAVVLLPSEGMGAMGTVLDDGRVLFISAENGVVIAPLHASAGHHFRLHK
jgi:hypothetical protein